MSDNPNRIFYFMFGYHHPDAWEAVRHDPAFEMESTGILPIWASDEIAASRWGKCVAKWYLSQLYLTHPDLKYNWSPDKYACWVEREVPEGSEEAVNQLAEIDVDSYPEYSNLKKAFQD